MTRQRFIPVALEVVHDPNRGGVEGMNPYTELLVRSVPRDRIAVRYFTWWFALFGRYDVLHLHWPEYLVRSPRPLKRALKRVLALALVARASMRRPVVVRTLHNQKPHESGDRFENWIVRRLNKATRIWIALNATTRAPDGQPVHVIEHGHFRTWYRASQMPSIEGRLLSFGLIRPYKGVERLLEERRNATTGDGLSLRIVGKPHTADLAAHLESIGKTTDTSFVFEYVQDEQLVDEIARCEAVIVPYPELHNSSAALLALSLHRPVVLIEGEATRLLRDEFGSGWVALIPREYSWADIVVAVEALRSAPRDVQGPDMRTREWDRLGDMLADLLETAVAVDVEVK